MDRSAPFLDDIVSKDRVIKLLKGLNPSKALGPDELRPRVLKELAIELGPVLLIFSNSQLTLVKFQRKGLLKYLPPFQEEWQVTYVQLLPSFLDLCTLQVTRTNTSCSMFKYHGSS